LIVTPVAEANSDNALEITPPSAIKLGFEAHPIHSLTSEQFEDLTFLKNILSNKRIVSLGESSHGVAEFSSMKVRLVKFLHEVLGFNLIAFESPFTACARADENVDTESPDKIMKECLFSVWHTEETVELFRYIGMVRAAGGDLHIAGFDIQDSSLGKGTAEILEQTLEQGDASVISRVDYAEAQLTKLRKNQLPKEDGAQLAEAYNALGDSATEFAKMHTSGKESSDRLAQFSREMSSRAALTNMLMTNLGSRLRFEIRDKAMAGNFEFLANSKYDTKKIIIWAHNTHIARHWPVPDSPRMMGDWVHEKFGNTLYTVGILMGQGSATFNNRKIYQIPHPDGTILEGILRNEALPINFVDMSKIGRTSTTEWMFNSILTRDWGTTLISITPRATFDGILYIDTVKPPKYM
jgi:erythromycin esterase